MICNENYKYYNAVTIKEFGGKFYVELSFNENDVEGDDNEGKDPETKPGEDGKKPETKPGEAQSGLLASAAALLGAAGLFLVGRRKKAEK